MCSKKRVGNSTSVMQRPWARLSCACANAPTDTGEALWAYGWKIDPLVARGIDLVATCSHRGF
jgi:hypothetical protein